ncbi:hypothetical protein BDB01DRAFT_697222, partial [Pilobolus umbonatus]
DDQAAFAYFQQELQSPKLQQVLLDTSYHPTHSTMKQQQQQQQYIQQQLMQQQQMHILQQQKHRQQQDVQGHVPSIMVPPQSPTLSSYYFENGWVKHYYDSRRRQHLSSRVETDYPQRAHRHNYASSLDDIEYSLQYQQHVASQQQQQQQHDQHQQHNQLHQRQHYGNSHDSHTIRGNKRPYSNISSYDPTQTIQPIAGISSSNGTTSTPSSFLSAAAAAAAAAVAVSSQNIQPIVPTQLLYSLGTIPLEECRENLLQFAHSIYSNSPQNPYLLPLLHSLHDAYPTHLPTILLLACVYYSYQDYPSSLRYNNLILKYDPNYVEAMSNIGTTLRSMGKASEAEKWWFQALPVHQLPRLQNLFYAKGNLKYALGDIQGAQKEYEKGLELAFAGMGLLPLCNLIAYVCGGANYTNNNIHNGSAIGGSGAIPLVLLQPEQATHILQLMFASSGGLLPGLMALNNGVPGASSHSTADNSPTIQQTNQTTSTILLTLAKLYQDLMNPTTSALAAAASTSGVPSLSILFPLYYLSLALQPSPSTANNLGIILSNIPGAVAASAIKMATPGQNNHHRTTGTMLAMQYYMYGLQLDPRHPHLYTNLGSLLKDMGHLNEAISMYEKAVEYNPRFDVALANLGNAIKDMGRVQDSVQWYRRAVEVNPNFVDAICGLVNSLSGVCDWLGRGSVGNEAGVDQFGKYFEPTGGVNSTTGWIGRIVDIVEKQLDEGSVWGASILKVNVTEPNNVMKTFGEKLVEQILICTNGEIDKNPSELADMWRMRLNYYQTTSSNRKNEGGWLIRL